MTLKRVQAIPGGTGLTPLLAVEDDDGGGGMPTFISEDRGTLAGGGGVSAISAVPATAKYFTVDVALHGATVIGDFEATQIHLPGDPGPRTPGANIPYGALIALVSQTLAGGVIDALGFKNNAAAAPGNDIDWWIRYYA